MTQAVGLDTATADSRPRPPAGRRGLPVPTPEEIAAAAEVLKRAREVRTLARRRARFAARRALGVPPSARNFRRAAFLCAWCGTAFEARVINRPATGRYCTDSCRQMAYRNRRQMAERRAAREARDA